MDDFFKLFFIYPLIAILGSGLLVNIIDLGIKIYKKLRPKITTNKQTMESKETQPVKIEKVVHIEITSSPGAILSSEVDKVLECTLNGKHLMIDRDRRPNVEDVKRNLEDNWSRFSQFKLGSVIEFIDPGFFEYTFTNGEEWVKYTIYLEDVD